jgi:hypothetical protein
MAQLPCPAQWLSPPGGAPAGGVMGGGSLRSREFRRARNSLWTVAQQDCGWGIIGCSGIGLALPCPQPYLVGVPLYLLANGVRLHLLEVHRVCPDRVKEFPVGVQATYCHALVIKLAEVGCAGAGESAERRALARLPRGSSVDLVDAP